MKVFTEKQLEMIENEIMEMIDDNLNYMEDRQNRRDLLEMIKDSVESRINEAGTE